MSKWGKARRVTVGRVYTFPTLRPPGFVSSAQLAHQVKMHFARLLTSQLQSYTRENLLKAKYVTDLRRNLLPPIL